MLFRTILRRNRLQYQNRYGEIFFNNSADYNLYIQQKRFDTIYI